MRAHHLASTHNRGAAYSGVRANVDVNEDSSPSMRKAQLWCPNAICIFRRQRGFAPFDAQNTTLVRDLTFQTSTSTRIRTLRCTERHSGDRSHIPNVGEERKKEKGGARGTGAHPNTPKQSSTARPPSGQSIQTQRAEYSSTARIPSGQNTQTQYVESGVCEKNVPPFISCAQPMPPPHPPNFNVGPRSERTRNKKERFFRSRAHSSCCRWQH